MHSKDGIEAALSLERIQRYIHWASHDHSKALELYALNTRISESLYTPLQMLEVALRNRIHVVLTQCRHERWFYDEDFITQYALKRQIEQAENNIKKDQKEITPGRLVADLSFGFWTAMVGSGYENVWQQNLNKIAKKENGKGLRRKELSEPLDVIRKLRNRIAHHEPIIYLDLWKHYKDIQQITKWLSPAAAQWSQENSRFEQVCPTGRLILAEADALSV